jgi:glycosyltransferase involved in cell wall biosynthesis
MRQALRIGYVTVDDPADRGGWSGTNHYLLAALRAQGHEVRTLGPLRPQPELFLCKAINQLMLRTTGKRYNYRDSVVMARAYARLLGPRSNGLDLIIAPAGLATTALLRTKVPIVYINDRCIAGALGYHRILSDLADFSRKESLALEQQALVNASVVVYSSQWTADAAMTSNPDIAHKVTVIPFGANLDERPAPPVARQFPPKKIKLLFLGVKWEDKGGPIAYTALQALKRLGHQAQLVVCGCEPPPELNDPDLVREGFLDKNRPDHAARLVEHLRTADMLILPTRFEAYGIVCCEAAAYGLPVLATRTGGIPTIVEEGRTGYLFDLNENGKAYAQRIIELKERPEVYDAMRTNARQRYEQVLNWDAFVRTLMERVQSALPARSAR